jgi:ornithine cyclodeaminase/alanine dehydrogenase-like protein (mu-crystallin family)
VDFDSYWTAEAMIEMDKISTDDRDQFDYYYSVGYLQTTPKPYADLGEIVVGRAPGREHDHERILAIHLGLAIDDMAVAPEIYKLAKEKGLGIWLPL